MDASMRQLDQEAERTLGRPSDDRSTIEMDPKAERMLLTSSNGRLIADAVEVPDLEEHIHRAVKQVEKSLRAKREVGGGKQELARVNKESEGRR